MENYKTVGQAAGTVGFMTLLSRIFGFIRDLVIAMMFGSSAAADDSSVTVEPPDLRFRATIQRMQGLQG